MRKTLLLTTALAAVLAAPAAATSGAEHQGVAGPGGFVHGYLTSTITIAKGDTILFRNLDVFDHNIVHDVETDGFGGKRNVAWCKSVSGNGHEHSTACPVFWSELIGTGGSTQVMGLNRVKAGKSYTFFCTEHHNMKGTLVVSD